MKTNELSGAALDWAVAKCEGIHLIADFTQYKPSESWAVGGSVVEREQINIRFIAPNSSTPPCWAFKSVEFDEYNVEAWADTPLIAAMRCYVASKLGNEVEVPEELNIHNQEGE